MNLVEEAKMIRKSFLYFFILLALTACTRSTRVYEPTLLPTMASTEDPAVALIENFPTPTDLPQTLLEPTIAPTTQPTLPPYEPFTVYSAVDGLFLRGGPGTSFIASTMLFSGDELTTNFMALGGEWLNVTSATGESGFVFTQLLQGDPRIASVPQKMPDLVSVVKGVITDVNGMPISGIAVNFAQNEDSVVVRSDMNGEFYFYLNTDAAGNWTVTYANAIGCESNVWVGSDCAQMKAEYSGTLEPTSLIIALPYTGEPLQFTWK